MMVRAKIYEEHLRGLARLPTRQPCVGSSVRPSLGMQKLRARGEASPGLHP